MKLATRVLLRDVADALVRPAYKAESRDGRRAGVRLTGASAVYDACLDFRGAATEHFVGFFLDVRHRVIVRRILAVGSMTGVEVNPRDVFRDAIVACAAAIIFVHNHPSGDTTPSRQDTDLTARLWECGELLGIPVVDHVVVAPEGYTSLAERGWLKGRP